jgi:hypothetical protein
MTPAFNFHGFSVIAGLVDNGEQLSPLTTLAINLLLVTRTRRP